MKLDVRELETFNRLAREGARRAVDSLAQLTGTRPTVEATRIDLVERDAIGDEFDSFAGVEVAFDGDLSGVAVLVFEAQRAEALAAALPVGGDTDEQVREVGNILVGGFLDGWADHLGTTLDLAVPEHVSGTGQHLVPADAPTWEDDQVFALRSRFRTAADGIDASIYLFPERESFDAALVDAPGDSPVPIDKLAVFNRMARRGAENAADHLTGLTGIETDVDVSRVTFVSVEAIPAQVADERHLGVVLELDGFPTGYAAVLFDEASGRRVADALVSGDGEFGRLHESAIREVGNVVSSGFVDGWANVLGTTIDLSPPEFVDDVGGAIMDPIAALLGQSQQCAFVVDSTIRTPDDEVACELYVLPDGGELREALETIDPGDAASVEIADPAAVFAGDAED